MRQLVSTALVACIVGALAGASFGAMAQAPAEPPVTTTALNADTVDRLSAVKATSKKARRKNKLVATDSKGFLPANIVKAKWGLIGGKPAFLADDQIAWNEVQGIPASLADGQIGWGEVAGIPASLADGVDDAGVTGLKVIRAYGPGTTIYANATGTAYGRATVTCPAGSKVTGGGFFASNALDFHLGTSLPSDTTTWYVDGYNTEPNGAGGTSVTIQALAICMSVEPAGAFTSAKKGPLPARVKRAQK